VLDLDDVDVTYNPGSVTEVRAMRALRLHIPRGQFVTVVGTNGAGKSTLVGVISGAIRPTRGRVMIAGLDVTRAPDYRRAALVARVFDNPNAGTCPELSIADNMALALRRGRRRGLTRAVRASDRMLMAERLSHLGLGLDRRLNDPVRLLSAGQRQSLTMVMAALRAPEVLLLDEHLAALDPGTQRTVLNLTVDMIERLNCTAVMVTHNMQHALDRGDRLLVFSRGQVIADLDRAAKSRMTQADLVARITGHGDTVSDRIQLGDAPRPS
jgi:putative ABC transport system ATP-binding protein